MNIDDLTVGELKQIAALINGSDCNADPIAQDKIGKYVIVRCKDAGVHAGVLVRASGRSCSLKESRRLWYWKPANGAAFLSGVASEGLDSASKVGVAVDIDLTENCEIILCSESAEISIRSVKDYRP